MKNLTAFFAVLLALTSCDSATEAPATASAPQIEESPSAIAPEFVARLEVSNPSDFARADTLLSFSLNELGAEEEQVVPSVSFTEDLNADSLDLVELRLLVL